MAAYQQQVSYFHSREKNPLSRHLAIFRGKIKTNKYGKYNKTYFGDHDTAKVLGIWILEESTELNIGPPWRV